jgi:effector-binding domain-containing protein
VPDVTIEHVTARHLAAVRRRVAVGQVGAAWQPALDQVWEFLRANPRLRGDGHNIFLYHHAPAPGLPMTVDFGVEVLGPFDATGEVVPVRTPAGEVATAVHLGPYDELDDAHAAIEAWRTSEGRTFAGMSWEIYGDPTPDPAQTRTTVCYLLSPL